MHTLILSCLKRKVIFDHGGEGGQISKLSRTGTDNIQVLDKGLVEYNFYLAEISNIRRGPILHITSHISSLRYHL